MQVIVERDNDSWAVVPTTGKFSGLVVARCDAIHMTGCKFFGETIRGRPQSIWGATLNQDLDLDRHTIQGLGVGKPFRNNPNTEMGWRGGGCITSRNTGERVKGAASVILFGQMIRYSGES